MCLEQQHKKEQVCIMALHDKSKKTNFHGKSFICTPFTIRVRIRIRIRVMIRVRIKIRVRIRNLGLGIRVRGYK